MSELFKPITIRSVTIKNRIMLSPMCQYCAIDGMPNTWHLVNYGTRAVGQVGLIMLEATAVEPKGRITPYDLGLYNTDISKYREIAKFIKQNGGTPGIQLAHAGRKASATPPWDGEMPIFSENGGWKTVAPSAIPFDTGWPVPKELEKYEIIELEHKFAEAAIRARKAGFEIIELHAAHGYLIHEFLSPVTNKRTDQYGGSFKNRVRFLLEIVLNVREFWPETLPLFVRISATDWVDKNGWQLQDSIRLAKILKHQGVDLIDVSSGGIVPRVHIPISPGYQVPFARQIRNTGIKTAAVGLIVTPEQAEKVISEGSADIVAMGRELLRNPYWPLYAAKVLGADITWPVQYTRAKI